MLYRFLFVLILLIVFSCNEETESNSETSEIVSENVHTGTYDHAFLQMLKAYDSVHAKLVDWDSTGAGAASAGLLKAVQTLPVGEALKDSTRKDINERIASSLKAELIAFPRETTLADMRRSFFSISEMVFNLATQSKFTARKVYKVSCPMAFNETEEAHWVSMNREVINPYLGTKHPRYKAGMRECGKVTDSTQSVR